jgi:predicted transcriptional regulator
MARKRPTKQKKSNQLLNFILKNPGLTVEQISRSLGWTNRSVRLVLRRLEKIGQISPRYFPMMATSIEPEHLQLEKQMSSEEGRLERMLLNLQEREKETFEKCVRAKMTKDEGLASMYANQCAEIRKLINAVAANESLLARMSLTLESLKLRRLIPKEPL